ncbi:MAG: hypothetical protein WD669_09485 [Pirellulales bacterium]
MFRRQLRGKQSRQSASRRRFRHLAIEPLEDRRLLAVVVVSNSSDVEDGIVASIADLIANPGVDGSISLREAIEAANNTPNNGGPDEIHFAIPGDGVQVINPANDFGESLPALTDAVLIDGFTQTDSSANTKPLTEAIDAVPLIQIDGSFTFGQEGLTITAGAGGSTIRGLVLTNFDFSGIALEESNDNIIIGNFIGTDDTGTMDLGNREYGIRVTGGSGNRIGGAADADRNLISGNALGGIVLDLGTNNNLVLGNFIGTDHTGEAALGSDQSGVIIHFGSNDNTIGGAFAGEGNLISGNAQHGIEIRDLLSNGNVVAGNFIGTNAAGTGNLGNGGDGIVIFNDAANNTIGGAAAGAGNTIAFNNDGVSVRGAAAIGNAIRGNSIFNNEDLGIDLADNGVTANDELPTADADPGPNRLQNVPTIVGSAKLVEGSIVVRYRVDTSSANGSYPLSVEFFAADADNQEGQTHLATDTYVLGEAETEKLVMLPLVGVATNSWLVATATDAAGNTSEFSVPAMIFGIGDYNANGIVDAADYTIWRNTLHSPSDMRADGEGDGDVDFGDYQVWRDHYGESLPTPGSGSATSSSVSEPSLEPASITSAVVETRANTLAEAQPPITLTALIVTEEVIPPPAHVVTVAEVQRVAASVDVSPIVLAATPQRPVKAHLQSTSDERIHSAAHDNALLAWHALRSNGEGQQGQGKMADAACESPADDSADRGADKRDAVFTRHGLRMRSHF